MPRKCEGPLIGLAFALIKKTFFSKIENGCCSLNLHLKKVHMRGMQFYQNIYYALFLVKYSIFKAGELSFISFWANLVIINPNAIRMATAKWSFGHPECNGINTVHKHHSSIYSAPYDLVHCKHWYMYGTLSTTGLKYEVVCLYLNQILLLSDYTHNLIRFILLTKFTALKAICSINDKLLCLHVSKKKKNLRLSVISKKLGGYKHFQGWGQGGDCGDS